MEFKFFTDLIDALGKVATGLKALVQLPKTERETICRTLNETYRLIDTTLNMVIIRLGDILLIEHNNDFMLEVAKLDNYSDWMQAEREFRLCKSLGAAARETETLRNRLTRALNTKDWDSLLDQMRSVIGAESKVAYHFHERSPNPRTRTTHPAGD